MQVIRAISCLSRVIPNRLLFSIVYLAENPVLISEQLKHVNPTYAHRIADVRHVWSFRTSRRSLSCQYRAPEHMCYCDDPRISPGSTRSFVNELGMNGQYLGHRLLHFLVAGRHQHPGSIVSPPVYTIMFPLEFHHNFFRGDQDPGFDQLVKLFPNLREDVGRIIPDPAVQKCTSV